jgi:hypothetical protein
LALVVVTVWSSSVPFALISVTVQMRLPSAFTTVPSVSLWSKIGLPLASTAPVVSCCVVFNRPLALVVVTVSSLSEPSALVSINALYLRPNRSSVIEIVYYG